MNYCFIGHFAPPGTLTAATSPAGRQVQLEIIKSLKKFKDLRNSTPHIYAMQVERSWPNGKLVVNNITIDGICYIGFINLPLFKDFQFALKLFTRLVINKPEIVVTYNSFLFENITLLIYKKLIKNTFIAIIIQDFRLYSVKISKIKRDFLYLCETIASRLLKYFDLVIPVSGELSKALNINPNKSYIFKGGITQASRLLAKSKICDLNSSIAVYAGALERYNGVDLLVKMWKEQEICMQLHIFGRGSLENNISIASKASDNIIFHGFKSELEVLNFQKIAAWNICLRFDFDINQKYFFPSKFFQACCAPGALMVNKFYGLPEELLPYLNIVNDDLCNLNELISGGAKVLMPVSRKRREIVFREFDWIRCIEFIVSRAKGAH